jgi:hypothetical protein
MTTDEALRFVEQKGILKLEKGISLQAWQGEFGDDGTDKTWQYWICYDEPEYYIKITEHNYRYLQDILDTQL